jgi:hypothetical protein
VSRVKSETARVLGENARRSGMQHFRLAPVRFERVVWEFQGQQAPEQLEVLDVGGETARLTRTRSNECSDPVQLR